MPPLITALSPAQRLFLQDAFGGNVSFAPEVLRVYASDASTRQGLPLAVICPQNVAQVQTLLRWAHEERVPVHPRGRGTGLSGGCVPTVPGLVLSTAALNKILEISPADFVALVEPGVCTAQFQDQCAKAGLFYPPDPASARASSLGGNAATCAGGLRAVKYGVTRDYVLGCEMVIPGGELLRTGRRCHKDVVGLDLTRLAVGSEGTLGVITKLILKLIPKPESSASVLAGYASLDAALESMAELFASGILPAAVEFMNETVLEILSLTGEIFWPQEVRSLLLFQVDGSREALPLELERLRGRLGKALWSMQGIGPEEEKPVWAARRRISAASYVLGPERIGGDMAVPRGELLNAVRRFESIAAAHQKRLIAFGHAGDGNIHANLHYDPSDADDAARTLAAHRAFDQVVLELGGSISGEHGIGSLKEAEGQLSTTERQLMRKIRAVFDPHGIMNPDKGY
ncbi:FAD-binding protein [Desulfovibrio sp. OttesenSCG-928-G11]|nr:FAD-binding protein [Desulfovibrio sp. OttesenSCG-928-G11]